MLSCTATPNVVQFVCLWVLVATVRACGGATWNVDTKECALHVPQPLQPHGRFGCPVPIDEKVEPRPDSWSPWTHPPACLNGTGDPPTKYCVFTNSRHGIGGVSIITTPQFAADSVDILNEPIVPGVLQDHALNSSHEAAYQIVDVPGKGKGVIATRLISKYENIMHDYASVLVDLYFPSSVKRDEGYTLLHIATDQLENPSRSLTLGRSNPMAVDVVEDILRTNAFHTDLAGAPHMALYPLVSVRTFHGQSTMEIKANLPPRESTMRANQSESYVHQTPRGK